LPAIPATGSWKVELVKEPPEVKLTGGRMTKNAVVAMLSVNAGSNAFTETVAVLVSASEPEYDGELVVGRLLSSV